MLIQVLEMESHRHAVCNNQPICRGALFGKDELLFSYNNELYWVWQLDI